MNNILFSAYPLSGIVFTCPHCGQIIASGEYAIGAYIDGEDDYITSPPSRLVGLQNQKANCCPQGADIPTPFVLSNFQDALWEIMKLYEREPPEGFEPEMFVGFHTNPVGLFARS